MRGYRCWSTGDRTISESDAIICHLARRAGSDLWPTDERQVDVVRWFSWNHVHFTRFAGQLYFEHIIKKRFATAEPDPRKVAEATRAFEAGAAVLDAHLGARDWLVGAALSLADFAVAITLPYAEEAKIPLDAFPAIRRWHARLEDLPAWRDPFPARLAVPTRKSFKARAPTNRTFPVGVGAFDPQVAMLEAGRPQESALRSHARQAE